MEGQRIISATAAVVVVLVVLVVLVAIRDSAIENVTAEAKELGLAQPLVFLHHPVDHDNGTSHQII